MIFFFFLLLAFACEVILSHNIYVIIIFLMECMVVSIFVFRMKSYLVYFSRLYLGTSLPFSSVEADLFALSLSYVCRF